MGKRGKKVKGTPKENKIRKLLNQGYGPTYIAKVVEVSESEVRTIKRNQEKEAKPQVGELPPVPKASKYSLAQLDHFEKMRENIKKWGIALSSWSVEILWSHLASGIRGPRVRDVEKAPYFPGLRKYPGMPKAIWNRWEELKRAVIPLEGELEVLWQRALAIAKEETGLLLIPTPQNEPVEGLTPHFFKSLLLRSTPYEWGQVNYFGTLGGWYNAQEGVIRPKGERLEGEVLAITTREGLSIPKNESVIIDSESSPDAVRFYLRCKYESTAYLALVRSPEELPPVIAAQDRVRKYCGPELAGLLTEEEDFRKLLKLFVGKLKEAESQG